MVNKRSQLGREILGSVPSGSTGSMIIEDGSGAA